MAPEGLYKCTLSSPLANYFKKTWKRGSVLPSYCVLHDSSVHERLGLMSECSLIVCHGLVWIQIVSGVSRQEVERVKKSYVLR
jgi:hypothetical protein